MDNSQRRSYLEFIALRDACVKAEAIAQMEMCIDAIVEGTCREIVLTRARYILQLLSGLEERITDLVCTVEADGEARELRVSELCEVKCAHGGSLSMSKSINGPEKEVLFAGRDQQTRLIF